MADDINYVEEQFADIQILRYRLNGFENLTLKQKKLVYYLSEATLWGRDITFDQFGKYNLRIRKMLEGVYVYFKGNRESADFKAFENYLKQVWFSNGIYHHYGYKKFTPSFGKDFLEQALKDVPVQFLPISSDETLDDFCNELFPVIFSPDVLPKRVNKTAGDDLVATSACNFYEGVTQSQAESFYANMKASYNDPSRPLSYGLNSTLVSEDGQLKEVVWKEGGRYGEAISKIIYYLEKAIEVAENDNQKEYIKLLVKYYRTGDLSVFNEYCIEWVQEHESVVDFVNGFIEVYGDPIGLKGSWEGLVEYKDLEATKRTQLISDNAQWFEDHSPVDSKFKKKKVKGVTATVICAAMLGGDEYPSTAIGINLPNADWIRAEYGSKSVTIGNITEAYKNASKGNGFYEEFVIDQETRELIDKYNHLCDELHTDLHECLGHGSGQLLPGVSVDALKAYGDIIEEARADLFGLYYIADEKLIELG
ncbi:MAG: dipeptidyl peptidase 3, partial [Prevotella sp.]|nr:dipeptidyl peptidase 3 [Prevotella sp.]